MNRNPLHNASWSFVGFALCFLLVGCEVQDAEWRQAPITHQCTAEQMLKSEQEAHWCNENTDYLSSFCYGSAIIRNCTKRKVMK